MPEHRARSEETLSQSSVREAIDAFARGEIVVVTDDDDRENEGDLIIAAAHVTPEKMAFIIRNTCGIVCAPVTREVCVELAVDRRAQPGGDIFGDHLDDGADR